MSNFKVSETCHFVTGLAPVADAFAGATVYSDVVNMKNYGKAVFIVFTGVGTTGTSTFTVQACDNTTPSNRSAIPFHYRSYDNSDVPGAVTSVAATGFANTAGSNRIHVIEVDAEALLASGYGYVQLKAAEVADSEVLGGILVMLCDPRSTENVDATAVV
jgi:delta 1-pyrroline-5-carboxylate dehydrogenase